MSPEEFEYLKRIEKKIDLLAEKLSIEKKKAQLLGAWISEKELCKIEDISRNTLLKLRQEGKITRSTISGKKNYYRMTDFKKLLDNNEGE